MANRYAQPPESLALNDCRLLLGQAHAGAPRIVTAADWLTSPAPPAVADLATLAPHPRLRLLPIDDQHVVAFVPSLVGTAVLNAPAVALLQRLPLSDPHERAAHVGAIAALDRLGLLTGAPHEPPPPPPPEALLAWMHVTNACNLRCAYCYIEKSDEQMSAETALRAVDAVIRAARAHGYRQIALKYAGGEPLLALDVVEVLHRYAQEGTRAAGIGLHATLLTNGSALTDEAAARLRDLGVGVTISLDGLAHADDAGRPAPGARPASPAAIAGVARARAAGLAPGVAIVASAADMAALPALADWLLMQEIPFSVSFARSLGGGPAASESARDQIIAGMRELYAAVARRPPRWSLLGALLDRADLSHPHRHACAAGESYLVIDQHGRVAACQMLIAQPVSSIHAADPLGELRQHPHGVQRVPVDARQGCSACEWRDWCGGGCPVATHRATGRYDQPSPHCAIYKALYPDLLRLEGLRLLHWRSPGG